MGGPFAIISERGGRFARSMSTMSLWIVIRLRRLSTTRRFSGMSIVCHLSARSRVWLTMSSSMTFRILRKSISP
jgi:hypothetical protein